MINKDFISSTFSVPEMSELSLMVPFLDLFNLGPKPNVEWKYEHIEGRNGYYVRALKDIARGEELFGSYVHSSG